MSFWTRLIKRWTDRVFIGAAAACSGDFAPPRGSWLNDQTMGADWLVRDSHVLVMTSEGLIAITGASRSSDQPTDNLYSAIGVSGAVINDRPGGVGFGLYSDLQHEPQAAWTVGLEVAAKNKGANAVSTPYQIVGGVMGVWLAGGGDPLYGGAPANPSNAAIVILKNGHTWNSGIVFGADALTGDYGVAMRMARRHQVIWDTPENSEGAAIRSDVTEHAKHVSLVFDNNIVALVGENGRAILFANHQPNAVNCISYTNAVAGNPPALNAVGDDADIDIALNPKGAGGVELSSQGQKSIEARKPATSLETGMLLAVNRSGTITVERVKIGAANSGGSGKRALVVNN